jgi:hypothetical protein
VRCVRSANGAAVIRLTEGHDGFRPQGLPVVAAVLKTDHICARVVKKVERAFRFVKTEVSFSDEVEFWVENDPALNGAVEMTVSNRPHRVFLLPESLASRSTRLPRWASCQSGERATYLLGVDRTDDQRDECAITSLDRARPVRISANHIVEIV